MTLWQTILEEIEKVIKEKLVLIKVDTIPGGSINRAYRLHCESQSYFVKLNYAHLSPMFQAEMLGLIALADTKILRIPKIIVQGIVDLDAFLVMEFVSLNLMGETTQKELGRKLAKLHRIPQAYFGWQQDNFIGTTVQKNTQDQNWVHFWQEQRLREQLVIAASQGYHGAIQILGEQLIPLVPEFFTTYQPQASLLHGDLWGGNAAADTEGHPIIYDPACYYGDREADIAMTELFGGYSPDFYTAYEEFWSLDSGYSTRKILYNLYHILNHVNLFGNGYLRQAESMMRQLIAAVK